MADQVGTGPFLFFVELETTTCEVLYLLPETSKRRVGDALASDTHVCAETEVLLALFGW